MKSEDVHGFVGDASHPSCGVRIISECEKTLRRLSNAGDTLRWTQETSISIKRLFGSRSISET
jgi:hypothetical protein